MEASSAALDHSVGIALEEPNQVGDDPVVVLPGYLPHARAAALLNVKQQTGPTLPFVLPELGVRTGPGRKGPE